ncbi:MAG: S9 family peptidase [Myxococcota bacterium]
MSSHSTMSFLTPKLQFSARRKIYGTRNVFTSFTSTVFLRFTFAASFCALASPVLTAEAASGMKLEDVFSLSYASTPIVSPDGKHVFYLRHSMDPIQDRRRSNLWSIELGSGRQEPITTGPQSVSSPALAPDGSRIAYVAKGEAASQLFVQNLDSGRVAQLTRGTQQPKNLSWSPDGKYIAFAMRVPVDPPTMGKLPKPPKGAEWAPPAIVVDRMVYRNDGAGPRPRASYQIFLIGADGGAPRQLTHGDFDHQGPIGWSSDSRSVFFSANRNSDRELDVLNSDVYALDLESSTLRQLTDRAGPENFAAISAATDQIAYLGYIDQQLSYQRSRLFVISADGSEPRELADDLDRSIYGVRWSKDGKRVYFLYDDEGDTVLASTDLRGRVKELQRGLGGLSLGRPYSGAAFAAVGDGSYVFTKSAISAPAELALGKNGKELRALTSLNANWMGSRSFASLEERWVTSKADGERIQAWIAYPPNFDAAKEYPLLLEIHGGPHTNYGARFSAEVQLYAAAGYVVVYANPRGSTSYGERFANLIHHNYPSEDYDDLMSVVDELAGESYIDSDRLFVTGGSGGGVLTAWIVGKTDRFRAAVVAKPVINWTSFVLTADNPPYFSRYWFSAMPWEDPEAYWRRSPLSLVGEVTTPTMLLTGEADLRTPISESEQYYQALRLRGVETAMVRIPEASHSIAKRPTQLMAKVAAVLAWFERHSSAQE